MTNEKLKIPVKYPINCLDLITMRNEGVEEKKNKSKFKLNGPNMEEEDLSIAKEQYNKELINKYE